MSLFKSRYEKELDAILLKLEMNCSNNYKDAAQKDFQEFQQKYQSDCDQGLLKERSIAVYREKMSLYQKKLEGFTHKDQKPFWN